MNLNEVLARADDESLEQIVGKPVVRLLNLLDPILARPSRLRELVTGFRTGTELLSDQRTRNILVDLLTRDQAESLAGRFGLQQANPYVALKNHRFAGRSEREILLAEFGIVDEADLDTFHQQPSSTTVPPGYGLFPHQREAAARTEHALAQSGHRVVLHMPTGSGKTRTAMHVIANHFRNATHTSVIWLAYSEELCEQAAAEFETAWSFLGDRSLDVKRFWGPHSLDLAAVSDSFVVAGLQKMYGLAKSGDSALLKLADRSSLVILDEAHQATAKTYQLTLELLVDRHEETRLLGLTATPGRTWNDVDEDEKLSKFFNRTKVALEIQGYANPIDYLVDEGYIARARFESIIHEGITLSSQESIALADSLDIPESILRALGDDEQRNLVIIDRVEQMMRKHERIIVFAPSVSAARLISTVLHARGADSDVVTGSTPSDQRARIISRFKANTPGKMVVVNYGVLTTGFDAPRTSAVVIARPTKSLVLYSQMVGRATRGTKAGGNATATIVTVVDTSLPGFGAMSESFENWEDVWKTS